VFTTRSQDAVAELELARNDAAATVRTTVGRLAPTLAVEMAAAAIPAAGDVAGGVIDVGDDLLEASDDVVEAIAAEIPGGGVVNQIWDVVLMPGRFGIRVATTALRREPPSS
jgi:hypothetical protein